MAVFEYRALDLTGREKKGTEEADSARQVRHILREKKLTPISIDSIDHHQKTNKLGKKSNSIVSFFERKLGVVDLALITRQLATLIQASMPIEESLGAIAAQQEKSWIKNIILSLRSQVLEGFTLASSLDSLPQHFPQMYRATIAAGEHAGHLDKILIRLADFTEKSMQSRQKVKLALLYPVILFFVSIAIVSFLLGFVVPDVIKVFIDNGEELPVITEILIHMSEGFQRWWLMMLIGSIALFILISKLLKRPKLRLKWHAKILKMPVIGAFSCALNTSQFAGTLSILTKSGVSVVDALVISAKVVSNDKMREGIIEAGKNVLEGSSLYRSLKKFNYFPPLMLHMIASGESTGELDNMLERASYNQQMELENKMAMLIGLFEPLMLVVMGGMVLFVVLAILLPILNINTLIH
ncbi:MAG: type II secretion system inner membrane protein GspF [Endozoicomonadaceae bacterium]|nr:type II secretion system inner membrane protein GspF [Endozoicomonadaceae bacterium]